MRAIRRRAVVAAAAAGLSMAMLPLGSDPARAEPTSGPVGGPLLASSGVVVAPGVRPPPDVGASWVVADLTSGVIFGARAAHARLRPASALKTLTALVLLPVLDPRAVYTATAADAMMQGTRVGMVPGATYTVDQLFTGMLVPSANDATHGLETAAGGQARTVALMTSQARYLQGFDTTVRDPSGLDQRGQFSSAYDLALFGRAAMRLPAFRAYVAIARSTFPGKMPKTAGKARSTFAIVNLNRLLVAGYPGMIGVKTGYTSQAGNTFIGAATRGGHTVLVTLMHTRGNGEVAERRLMDWALANVTRAGAVGQLVGPASAAGASPSVAAVAQVRTTVSAGSGGGPSGSTLVGLVGLTGAAAMALGGAAVMRSSRRRRRQLSPLGLAPVRRR